MRRGTDFSREIAEAALAHVVGDATERAYRRGDALEKRRKLMDTWASYCEPEASNIVPMGSSRADGSAGIGRITQAWNSTSWPPRIPSGAGREA